MVEFAETGMEAKVPLMLSPRLGVTGCTDPMDTGVYAVGVAG
jgi:hypothetical protein